MTPNPPISRDTLAQEGLGWLLKTGLLGALSPADQDAVLAAACFMDYPPRHLVMRHGQPPRGVDIIVRGHVAVLAAEDEGRVLFRHGPGTLIGKRSMLHQNEVRLSVQALSPLRTLHLRGDALSTLLLQTPALADYLHKVVEVRERVGDLLQLLSTSKVLRALGRQSLELLLQSAELLRQPPGTRLSQGDAVYVVVRGTALLYHSTGAEDPAQAPPLAVEGPGSIIGHRAALWKEPSPLHMVFGDDTELLSISGRSFRALLRADPRLARQLGADVPVSVTSAGGAPRAFITALGRSACAIGGTTLGYGLAAVLKEGSRQPPILIDLEGEEAARRLGQAVLRRDIDGVPAAELGGCERWGLRVLWPQQRTQLEPLLQALRSATPHLLVTARGALPEGALRAAHALVALADEGDDLDGVPDAMGQLLISVLRLGARPGSGSAMGQGALHRCVRVLDDPEAAGRFWHHGDLLALVSPRSALGRSCRRLARVLQGRSVGLALGGGGAWGFAHITLLERLQARGIPVDYIAGSSFGALVAGLYAAGGLAAAQELVKQRWAFAARVAASTIAPNAIADFVDQLTGSVPIGATEIPFFAVSTDLRSGADVVYERGTVGECVRASSGMPPLFAPLRSGGTTLLDGGFSNNVPASVVWNGGADFVIAANIIPRRSDRLALPPSGWPMASLARFDHLIQGLLLMMWRNGLDCARSADYTFDLGNPQFMFLDFAKGAEISAAAGRLIDADMPRMESAYQAACGAHRARAPLVTPAPPAMMRTRP